MLRAAFHPLTPHLAFVRQCTKTRPQRCCVSFRSWDAKISRARRVPNWPKVLLLTQTGPLQRLLPEYTPLKRLDWRDQSEHNLFLVLLSEARSAITAAG